MGIIVAILETVPLTITLTIPLTVTSPSEDDSDDSDDEMPQLEGADSGPTPGVMTDEQMSKAKQTRYFIN